MFQRRDNHVLEGANIKGNNMHTLSFKSSRYENRK